MDWLPINIYEYNSYIYDDDDHNDGQSNRCCNGCHAWEGPMGMHECLSPDYYNHPPRSKYISSIYHCGRALDILSWPVQIYIEHISLWPSSIYILSWPVQIYIEHISLWPSSRYIILATQHQERYSKFRTIHNGTKMSISRQEKQSKLNMKILETIPRSRTTCLPKEKVDLL